MTAPYVFPHQARNLTLGALTAPLVIFLLVLSGCRQPSVVRSDEGVLLLGKFEESATMQRGVTVGSRTLVVESETGGVTITGSAGTEAVLSFSIMGRGDSRGAAQSQIEKLVIEESGDESEYRYNVVPDRADMTTINIDGQIPRNASLRLLLRNGDVNLTNVDGTIEVRQENGSIVYLGGGESVNISTRNGDVFADFYRITAGSRIDVNVDNGDISFGVPETANVALDARTRAGTVTVHDLQFLDEKFGRNGAGAIFKAKLGNGAAAVFLKTINGSFTLNRVDLTDQMLPPIPAPADVAEPADSLSNPAATGAANADSMSATPIDADDVSNDVSVDSTTGPISAPSDSVTSGTL